MEIRRLSTTLAVLFGVILLCICTGAELVKKDPVKLKIKAPPEKKTVHKKVIINDKQKSDHEHPRDKVKVELNNAEELKRIAAQKANDHTNKHKKKEEEERLAAQQANVKPHHKKTNKKKEEDGKVVEGAGDGPIDIDETKKGHEVVKETHDDADTEHHGDKDESYVEAKKDEGKTDEGKTDEEEEDDDDEENDETEEDSYEYYGSDEDNNPLENENIARHNQRPAAPPVPKPKKQVPNLEMLSGKLFEEKMQRGTRFILNVGELYVT